MEFITESTTMEVDSELAACIEPRVLQLGGDFILSFTKGRKKGIWADHRLDVVCAPSFCHRLLNWMVFAPQVIRINAKKDL